MRNFLLEFVAALQAAGYIIDDSQRAALWFAVIHWMG